MVKLVAVLVIEVLGQVVSFGALLVHLVVVRFPLGPPVQRALVVRFEVAPVGREAPGVVHSSVGQADPDVFTELVHQFADVAKVIMTS